MKFFPDPKYARRYGLNELLKAIVVARAIYAHITNQFCQAGSARL